MDFVDLPSGDVYVVFNTGNQGEATPPNVPTSFDAAGVVRGATSRQWLESYFPAAAKTDDAKKDERPLALKTDDREYDRD
jgi:hypothetical protein